MPKLTARSLPITLLVLNLALACHVLQAQIVTGTYTGDGNSTQAISGIGSEPTLILVIPETGGAETGEIQTWIHSSTMPVGEVKYTIGGNSVANSFKTGFISSLDSDGFTVASKANVSGTTYYYVSFSDDDGSVLAGTFTGSTSAQNIVTGYEPGMVWVWADAVTSPDYVKWTVSGRPSGTYRFSHGEGGWGETIFSGFSPIGFSVQASGTAGTGIVDGGTYHYLAFQGAITEANPGWGSGPDKVTTSFEPGFLMTRHSTTHGNNTYIKTAEMNSGESFIPRHQTAETNALLDFESDGYTVGSTGQLRDKHWYFATEKISALPVELIKFKGQIINDETFISWTTASEIDNDYFQIQVSNDGINWETIRIVKGAGNSTTQLNYAENIGSDENRFYRLKQVDFDGSFDYSNVIYIPRNSNQIDNIVVFPNPAENQINLVAQDMKSDNYVAKVIAMNGAVVRVNNNVNFSTGNLVQFSIEDLAKGIYTLVVTNESGYQVSKRFVKK